MIRRRLIGETVIVHQNGPSIRGVLIGEYKDLYVLAHGQHLDDQVQLAGEVRIPKVPGVWLQTRLPAEPTA